MIVYIIHNKINSKKYIGSDSNNNPKYFGSGTYIKKAIKKYGKENFEKVILNEVNDLSLMKELEEYWINYFNAYDNPLFYNATKYSAGITKYPEDKKINVSNANKGNKYHLGFSQTEYQKSQTRLANLGRKQSQNEKDQRSKSMLGNKYALGNIFSLESREKISKAKIGCICSNETKQKISNKNNKPVLQYTKDGEFIKEWKSAKEVCRHFNITSIHRSLISWNNNSKGFKWKFKNQKT
jgi:group I intron endonuclease